MRLTRTGGIGLALIAAGLLPLVCWTVWFHTRTWCPVDMPVSLSQGSHFSTGEFAVNLNAQYAIDINAKGRIPVDDLGCLLGNDMSSTCPASSLIRVRWVLSSNGVVAQGTSDDSKGGGASYSDGEAFRTIGVFQGEKGRHYKLDIDVLADGSNLELANPRVSVRVFDTKYESGLVLSGLLRLVCLIFGLVGAALLVTSLLAQRRGSPPLAAVP